MRLTAFRVQHFRNVVDSTTVPVEPGITCLVGQNESGKTALLQALWRAKPHREAEFDPQEHYPRWLLTQHRKSGLVDATAPISVTFELDADDVAAVAEALGPGVLTSDTFTYSVEYDGPSVAWLDVDSPRAVANLLDELEVSASTREVLSPCAELEDLTQRVAEELEQRAGGEPDEQQRAIVAELRRVQASVPEGSAWQQAVALLKERMPTFFYFGDYQILPGRVALDELAASEDQPGATGLQTARALLGLAGTSTAALGGDQYEHRKAELEAVSNDLTREVVTYWRQNPELSVDIDVDTVTESSSLYGSAHPRTRRYLDVRVRDRRHGFTNNFGERSSGFQWFFSFLAAFSEFSGRERQFVVLLDEPALTLHGTAQADFLRFIEERLAPQGQVLYTTHSPFMVDMGRLERVRIVEDKGPHTGAVVSTDVLSADPETLFPLHAALGYDVAQHSFAEEPTVVVAEISDFVYLSVLSEHLRSIGRQALAPEWRLLPAGAAASVPVLVALMGRPLGVTVVVGSTTPGMQRLEQLPPGSLLDGHRLVPVSRLLDRATADVEDLFAEGDYLALHNGAFGTRLRTADLAPGERILDRISRTEGRDPSGPSSSNRAGRPADYLLRTRNRALRKLSRPTLDRFESLFAAVNATLP